MLGTWLGLQTSLRGLQTAQEGINTVSHNIDNANTPGYSRQVLDLSEAQAIDMPGLTSAMAGQVGQGVAVEQIQRMRSSFLDSQYRDQNASLGQANVEQSTLSQISGIIDEPSQTGISNAMQQFWQAWDTLGSGTNTDSLSVRAAVLNAGTQLTNVMNQTANQLTSLHSDLDAATTNDVTQVNSILSQVANLSNQIARVQETGNQPNDLMDQRDELLDQLSQYTSFTASTTTVTNGGVPVTTPVAPGTITYDQFTLKLTGDSGQITVIDGSQTDFTNAQPPRNLVGSLSAQTTVGAKPSTQVSITQGGVPVAQLAEPSGELAGYKQSLTDIQNYQDDLDNLAGALANKVNGLEPGGFFSGTTASNIAVQITNPSNVVAGIGPGDGSIALQISQLKDDNTNTFPDPSNNGGNMTGTMADYLTAVVGQLGLQGQTANNTVSVQQTLTQQVDSQRQSVSGVSIDEEMTNMISYQQAYNASAKVIQTINDMLSALMSEKQS
ncbi:flagellar hook-associated protein FlgK [Alicyclobacillus dauci]|uniref:Flagellar hook-associated protein 1 n=1 Tax=Alicyclobacillus dauci TaxID=1475485 RepID=A0ABY6Z6M5_9BACL|nr:flagellar hook-associated protein FlgK [Alicyclobacillus dauci]WAH37685.1 flagellar hook-associated protein FlgK [Alicyclobacillus dauci]